MTEPAISIIIPAYNALPYLHDTIDSLFKQTTQDFEIILVDDESTDGETPAVCDEYARRYPGRIFALHHSPNSGCGISRNVGMKIARGKYIFFLDADDLLHPRALQTMLTQAEEHDLDIMRCSRTIFYDGKPPRYEAYDTELQVYSDPALLRRVALCYIGQPRGGEDHKLHYLASAWGALYRRDFLERNALLFISERECGSEDFVFNFHAALKARRLGFSADTFVHYRITRGSITRTIPRDRIKRLVGDSLKMEQMVADAGFDAREARLAGMGYFLETARGFIKYALLGSSPYREKIAWAKEQCRLPYVQAIFREYPARTLLPPHRLHLFLMKHRAMRLLHLLTLLHH